MDFESAVREIDSAIRLPGRAFSLEPMRQALEERGLLKKLNPDRVIVVAGTNGKGSTCAQLEALLLAAGQDVALFTSPHLECMTERFRRRGSELETEAFLEVYQRIRPTVGRLGLVHFEILTLLALELWLGEAVGSAPDWLILEVGLGGLWDATNAVPHRFCGITRLGLDHQDILGPDLISIARNKFGIVGSGARVVHTPFDNPEVERLAIETAQATSSHWTQSRPCTLLEPSSPSRAPQFRLQTPWGTAALGLPGSRGAENAALALSLFEALGFDPSSFLESLSKVNWPGRMERLHFESAPCPVYVSGDHNPQGVASLLSLLKSYQRRHLWLVCGIARDKDASAMLGPLAGVPQTSLLLTETPYKTRFLEEYPPSLRDLAWGLFKSPEAALDQALTSADEEDMVLVTGSLYLVGQIRALSRKSCQD